MRNNIHKRYLHTQQYKNNPNIELSYRCPLMCSQCFRGWLAKSDDDPKNIAMKKKIKISQDISLDDLRKLFDFFKGTVSFCGQFSDPIYHPDFYKILDICTNEYPSTVFQVHTAAHQKNIEWYKEAFSRCGGNIKWIFGLDGLGDTSAIYRVNQKSEIVREAMLLANNTFQKHMVVWQFIVFKHNEHQIEEAKEYATMHNLDLKFVYTDRVWGNVAPASNQYRAPGVVKINKLFLSK